MKPFFESGDPRLGVQIYTLGPDALTDLDATFAAIAEIGYGSVELLGACNHSPAEVKAALARSGLTARSTHIPFQDFGMGYDLTNHLDASMDAANELGLSTIVAPLFITPARLGFPSSPAEAGRFLAMAAAAMTADDWTENADRLNEAGAALKKRGLRLAYHNHNTEFTPIGGATGYDFIVQKTEPALVTFELDIGWVAAAGLNPVDVLGRYPGRFSLLHLKDIKDTTKPNFAVEQDPAILGEGIIDLPSILRAARAEGVTSFYVEQEPPFAVPRLEAVRRGYGYLRTVAG